MKMKILILSIVLYGFSSVVYAECVQQQQETGGGELFGTLIGAAVGGLVGSQIGGGTGNKKLL